MFCKHSDDPPICQDANFDTANLDQERRAFYNYYSIIQSGHYMDHCRRAHSNSLYETFIIKFVLINNLNLHHIKIIARNILKTINYSQYNLDKNTDTYPNGFNYYVDNELSDNLSHGDFSAKYQKICENFRYYHYRIMFLDKDGWSYDFDKAWNMLNLQDFIKGLL